MSGARLPSEETEERWVHARRDGASQAPARDTQPGRWFIDGKIATIDPTWAAVRDACRAGRLGRSAHCTTAHPSLIRRYSGNATRRVEGDDWRDEEDVWRIERAVRALGIRGNLRYKVDSAAIGGMSVVPYRSLDRGDGTYERSRLIRRDGIWDSYTRSDREAYETLEYQTS